MRSSPGPPRTRLESLASLRRNELRNDMHGFRNPRRGFANGLENVIDARFEPEVLSAILGTIKRLQESGGSFVGERAYFEEACSFFRASLTYETLQASEENLAILQTRAKEMKADLFSATRALDMIQKHISLEAEALDSHIEACRLRRGLASLPDEILSVILEYAANRDRIIVKSIQAAAKLSHVCQRFRRLIISQPRLWSWWSYERDSESGMISTCVTRCGHYDAKLVITVSPGRYQEISRIRNFLRLVCQKPDSWSHLRVEVLSRHAKDLELSDGELVEVGRETEGIILPNLTSLHYTFSASRVVQLQDGGLAPAHYYSTWFTPRLNYMLAKNFIPVPFSGSSSLKSLTINVGLGDINPEEITAKLDIGAIVTFLSSCLALEYLSLRMGVTGEATQPTPQQKPFKQLSLVTIELRFLSCSIAPVRLFTENIHFPKLSTLSVHILMPPHPVEAVIDDTSRGIEEEGRNALEAIFSSSGVFPSMTKLKLNMVHDNEPPSDYWRGKRKVYDHYLLSAFIPSANVPNLKHLHYNATEVKFVPEDGRLPSLKSLVLNNFDGQFDHVDHLLEKLKEQGDNCILKVAKKQTEAGTWEN